MRFNVSLLLLLAFSAAFAQETETLDEIQPQEAVTELEAEAPDEPTEEAPPPPPTKPAPKRCDKRYNINELVFKVQNGFPVQLKDCGTSLVKEIALSKSPFSKKAAPEPKSFMTQCTMDGIKEKLPDGFPNVDKVTDDIQNFLQVVLNNASAGGSLDPKKLLSSIGDMNIDDLLNGIKNLADADNCVVAKPYVPSADDVAYKQIDSGIDSDESSGASFWVALAFDLIGAGFIVYGITKNSDVSDNYDKYNSMRQGYSQQEIDRAWKKAEDARSSRNTAYIIGASALTIGVGVHIWF